MFLGTFYGFRSKAVYAVWGADRLAQGLVLLVKWVVKWVVVKWVKVGCKVGKGSSTRGV